MFKKSIVLFFIMIFGSQIILAISEEAQRAVEVLKSTDASARRQAAAKLSRLRSRETVPVLIEALEDEDFGVRTNAADALGNLRDSRAVDPLIKRLKDENRSVRISAVVALGFIRNKKAVEPLINVLKKESNSGVRISAAQVLGILGDTGAVKPLINALSDKDKRVRIQAVRSLGKLGAEEAAGPLIEVTRNKKEGLQVKKYAVEALGEIKTAKSINTLKKLLKSDQPEIAVTAGMSLGKLGKDDGLDVILKGTESENVKIRRQAVMALSYIGVKNNKVIKAVKRAVKDEDARVRKRAEFIAKSLNIELKEEENKEKEKKKE